MWVQHVERTTLIGVLVILIGLSIWMQFGLLTGNTNPTLISVHHKPDYFIRNFIATGRNETTARYVLTGVNLEHFPDDRGVEIERPCLLLLEQETLYRHVYGDTGRIITNGDEVIFSGNVQVLERLAADADDWDLVIAAPSPDRCFQENLTDTDTLTRSDELVVRLKPLSER